MVATARTVERAAELESARKERHGGDGLHGALAQPFA
jgi:hypothetical protein